MKKLTRNEMENYRSYHIPGCGSLNTLKLDAVFFNAHNSKIHEMKKAEICFELLCLGKHFLTEAEKNRCKGEPVRRVDVVDLTTGDEIEIETDPKIQKFKNGEGITIYI